MRCFIFATHHVLKLDFSSAYNIYSLNMIINNIPHSSFNCFSNLYVPAIPVLPQQSGSGGEMFHTLLEYPNSSEIVDHFHLSQAPLAGCMTFTCK